MNEESLFAAARALPTAAERKAFLQQACAGDARLRQRLEDLLLADADTHGILDHGRHAAVVLGVHPPEPSLTPEQVFAGRFWLGRKLGEGGMGEVWVADQVAPVQRRVAVKLIRPGLGSARALARFEQERQALALMNHPNIAKVLDAGVDGGRPFFVMELIEGTPLTPYCDDKKLTVRERLELFLPVCEAVQHAHTKGVIHRDLKPANILVESHDARPVPRVIDFGLAKPTGPLPSGRNVSTEIGTLVGTPEYMSPEQADLNNPDVDTRSDVYALGVVLYELLTGTVPFSRDQFQGAPFAEVLRIIKEVEPPTPGRRLASEPRTLLAAADARQAEPRKLLAQVRGELDWIAMKCLEKDPARRYGTANELAADVRRYLGDEPVLAGPPTTGYRLRKFLRRHRGPVLAAGVVLLALVAGVVGTSLGLVEADHARQVAVTNAGHARTEAENAKTARDLAVQQLLRADWLLYVGLINQAQQAWENNNARLAYHHLESCDRDFRGWEHDYLFTLFHGHQRTFGNARADDELLKKVSGVAFSPDGKRIVSGSYNSTVRVWEVETGRVILNLDGPPGSVASVAFSPDGHRIALGTFTGSVQVRNAATGREFVTLKGHTNRVDSVAFSPDGQRLVSGSVDETVKVWNAQTGEAVLTLKKHTGPVGGVAFSPDGKLIVSGSADQTLRVWDAGTGQEIQTLRGHTGPVTSVAFSPDGTLVVSGGGDLAVKLWEANTGREVRTLWGHTGVVMSVAFSPDGKRLVSGGSVENAVRVWDAGTGANTLILRGHTDQVSGVAFSPNGTQIVSGSWDNTVKVWDAGAGHEPRSLKGSRGLVGGVAFSPDGRRIVSGSWDNTVKVWARDGAEPRVLRGHTKWVTGVAVNRNGTSIASGSADRTVRVWDAGTGENTLTLKGHTDRVGGVAFSPDGKRLASGGWDNTVRVWDAARGGEPLLLKGHTGAVTSVAFSPVANRVVSGGADQTVRVWDVESRQEILTLQGHTGEVTSVACSPDGTLIVSGGMDQTVRVWGAATGENTLTLRGHTGAVSSVALMPDGKRIASGSHDKMVKIWDPVTGNQTLTLKGHTNAVNCVAFSPDGKHLVSGSTDQTVRVWDASMSQRIP